MEIHQTVPPHEEWAIVQGEIMEKNTSIVLAAIVAAMVIIAGFVVMTSASAGTPPSKPLNIQATRGDQQVALQWFAPDDDGGSEITGYVVLKGTASGTYPTSISLGAVTSYVDHEVQNGVPYFYCVAAKNKNGQGERSNEATATPSAEPVTVPTAPRDLQAVPGQASATLTWLAPLDNGGAAIIYYQINYTEVGSSIFSVINVGNVLSYKIENLEAKAYRFSLCAVNSVGASPSIVVNSTPLVKSVNMLTIGTTVPITSISLGDGRYSEFKMLLSQQPLVTIDVNGNYIGLLATNWSSNAAFTEWTFHLRQGVHWSDGERFDADDVVFNFLMHKKRASSTYTEITNVSKVDDFTVKVKLSAANSNFLYIGMNMVQQPSHVYLEKVGPVATTNPVNYTNYAGLDASIGTGPYILTGFNSLAGTLTWTVNPDYWGGTPTLKNVTVRLYSNTNAMMMALLNGQIDTIYNYVSPGMDDSYLGKVLSDVDLNVMTIDYTGLPTTLFFNYDSTLGSNHTIRHAIRSAIDYQEVIELIALVSGSMANEGVVPPGNQYYIDTAQLMYDKQAAIALLDAAGIVDTNSNGVRELGGQEVVLKVIIRSEQEDSIRAWELVEEYLEDVGLGVDISVLSSAEFTNAFRTTRNYDILTFIMTPAGVAMHAGYGTTYTQRNKFCNITDPDYLAIVNGLLSTSDPGEREDLAAQIQTYYAEEASMIPLYWSYYLQPYNKRLSGFESHPYWGILCEETYFNLADT